MSNRVLLHPRCHNKVHAGKSDVVKLRLVDEALSEALAG